MPSTFLAAATSDATAVAPVWLPLVMQLATALIGGSIAATFISHLQASAEKRRERYAEAVACLVGWVEYPYRVRRRVNDEAATLEALVQHGHELQERIARSEAWVTSESRKMGELYSALVADVKSEMGPLISEAWKSPPAVEPPSMVLNGWGQDARQRASLAISDFRKRTRSRFGWRRLFGR